MTKWIKCSDRLPNDKFELYLTCNYYEGWKECAIFHNGHWYDHDECDEKFDKPIDSSITHWAELPELPHD